MTNQLIFTGIDVIKKGFFSIIRDNFKKRAIYLNVLTFWQFVNDVILKSLWGGVPTFFSHFTKKIFPITKEKIKIEWQWASKRCRFKQRFIDIFLASNLVNKQKETFCKQMQKNLYTNIFEIFKSLYGSIEQFFSGLNPNKVTFFKKNFVLH